MSSDIKKIGTIVSGSLSEGLTMRLDQYCPLESIKTGKFVSVAGDKYRYFSLITDLELGVSHPDVLLFPPTEEEHLLRMHLANKDVYANVVLRPMLMLDEKRQRMPVKTIPGHFSRVFDATAQDVAAIFGTEESARHYFNIGVPLDMDTPVCLDLSRFTERSNGIFGKTGTGKTFITRLILAGLVRSNEAVNLVFDMHSEYGYQARKEGDGQMFVRGLKSLFPNRVVIFSLDPAATRRRGCTPDVEVLLGFDDIHVDDVLTLQDELSLHPTALEAAYLIASKYREKWLQALLEQEKTIKEFSAEVGAHPESVGALFRKLKRLEKFPFLVKQKPSSSVVDRMMEYLGRGMHVVLEFGNQSSMLCYLLVANIVTRRIHEEYVAKTEKFLASQNKADEPRKLMITIEEAHKFLNPAAAKQTIFGVIAREMRKYYVALLVVDQRPSGIDEEVLSQIGTKIVALLNDEKDIQAVLTGVSNSTGLRSILATLDTKKQALVLGHAIAMPVVIKTREYDDVFYAAMAEIASAKTPQAIIDEIF